MKMNIKKLGVIVGVDGDISQVGMYHLSKSMMENREFLFPMFREQQAIGAYFSNLDNLINSHQEKISQLETLKKKLLQDMFI